LDDVAANRLESEHPLVERARGVHVESPQADVRPPFAYNVGRPSRPDSMFYISSAFACATAAAPGATHRMRSQLIAVPSSHCGAITGSTTATGSSNATSRTCPSSRDGGAG